MPVDLENHAWLVVDIEDSNGDGVSGQTISISNATAADGVYTECNGTDGDASSTTVCPNGWSSPMFIAYFDASSEATVTVGSETQTAPIRMGEITALEFEVAAVPVGTIAAGQAKYDVDCADCHAAGDHDTKLEITKAGDLAGQSSKLISELSSLGGMNSVTDLTSQEILDLTAFLDSLSP
jgi:mono/diheme cytochrome c family protein